MTNPIVQAIFGLTPEEREAEDRTLAAEPAAESYLRRIHFWIRLWSVVSLLLACLYVIMSIAELGPS